MILRDDQGTFEIEVEEIVDDVSRPDVGDRRLAVEVSSSFISPPPGAAKIFRGRNSRVWVSARAWSDFVAGLRELQTRRSGNARLTSMSPAELELRIHVYDAAGHVRATGHLGADIVWRDGTDTARIPFRVEMNPGILPHMVTAFEGRPTLRRRLTPPFSPERG